MKNRFFIVCGILSPLVYLFTVVLGGLLRPDYSHIAQPVSDLIAAGAPNKALLDGLFILYNALALLFGFGLFQIVRAEEQNRSRAAGLAGAIALILEGLAGLLTLVFPEDRGGMAAGISSAGTMHIVFAGLSSLTSMLAILLMGFWLKNSAEYRGYGIYSFISVAFVFVCGGMAGLFVAGQNPLGGLVERLTIGGFLQWMLVMGWRLRK